MKVIYNNFLLLSLGTDPKTKQENKNFPILKVVLRIYRFINLFNNY